MSGFRSHRSRFRREKLTDQANNQEQNSVFSSSLGQKLASFKSCPDPDLEQKFNLLRSRPLFFGACGTCTTFSKATYLPESIYNYSAIQNSLVGDLSRPASSATAFTIDFQNAFENSNYVSASLHESSNAKDPGDSLISSPLLQEYIATQNIQQETEGPYSWFQSLKSWLLRKLLSYMFPHGILYHPGQIQVLERCSKSKAPFLFLPVHKSPLDSIVIKSVLEKTPSRHDLKTFLASRPKEIQLKPGFQILDDSIEDIAWSLQQATVSSIFVNHGNILTFLESEVCKEGRPNLALDGTVLDHALQCIYDDVINDIQIVPVGISYQGTPLEKWPQNFRQYIKVFFGFWSSSPSYARVDFDQPFSLKEFKNKWEQRLYFRMEEESQIHQKVKSALALHSLYTSWHTSRFMLTDLLAFLTVLDFDHKRPDQIRAVKLKELIEDIQMRKRFIGFIGPQSDADLQSILNESLIKSWLAKSSKAELELFSTSVKRLYVKEGIVMSALGSLINQPLRAYSGMKADVTIKRGELVERSLLAFDLLCYEDHYALPCKDMQDVIDESIQLIKHREIIYVKEEIQSEHFQERWARNMARNIEREMFDEDENERITTQDEVIFHVSTTTKVLEDMDFLIELMRPIFRSYYDLIRYISLKKCRKMTEPSEYGDSLDYGNTGCRVFKRGVQN